MTIRRTCAAVCLAWVLTGCGGSGSETPPPVEPTAPRVWEPEPGTSTSNEAEAGSPEPSPTLDTDPREAEVEDTAD